MTDMEQGWTWQQNKNPAWIPFWPRWVLTRPIERTSRARSKTARKVSATDFASGGTSWPTTLVSSALCATFVGRNLLRANTSKNTWTSTLTNTLTVANFQAAKRGSSKSQDFAPTKRKRTQTWPPILLKNQIRPIYSKRKRTRPSHRYQTIKL